MVKFFYDLETTGTDPRKHSIHQLAGLVEVDDEIVEVFDIRTRPHPRAKIEPEALKIAKVTEEEILSYQPMEAALKEYKRILSRYVDPYNPKIKAYNVGYNNRYFDDVFLRAWFDQNKDTSIGSWFWSNTIDVLVLATEYLVERRPEMPSFKLHRVAKTLGLQVDDSRTHDTLYDVGLTRSIYRIVTGRDIEL